MKKNLYAYLILLASVLILITTVLGATQHAMTTDYNFSILLIVVMSIGVAVGVLTLFIKFDFLPLICSILFSVGFGLIFHQGIAVIVDQINNIAFQGGNPILVELYLALTFVACVLSFVACFIKKENQ